MADSAPKCLLQTLPYKPNQLCTNMASCVSRVSAFTGDGKLVGGSTICTEDTTQRILHSKDCALKLAEPLAEAAEWNAQIKALQEQDQQLTAIMAGTSAGQGAPTLVEARPPTP
jgi:hypothetical protein